MHIMRAMWISYKHKFNPNRRALQRRRLYRLFFCLLLCVCVVKLCILNFWSRLFSSSPAQTPLHPHLLSVRCVEINFSLSLSFSVWVCFAMGNCRCVIGFLKRFYRIFTKVVLFCCCCCCISSFLPLSLYFVTIFFPSHFGLLLRWCVYELWLWTQCAAIIPLYCLFVSCGFSDFSMWTSDVSVDHTF